VLVLQVLEVGVNRATSSSGIQFQVSFGLALGVAFLLLSLGWWPAWRLPIGPGHQAYRRHPMMNKTIITNKFIPYEKVFQNPLIVVMH
jgi:hypothetical protein